MDKHPVAEDGDARSVLAGWLDDFSAGNCDRDDMQESFLSVCRSNPDAPWDALALLDQYQRRGKVDAALVRELKAHIAQLVFGVPNQTEGAREDAEVSLDTTGSRWRKLLAERDPASINSQPQEDEEDEDEEEDDLVEPVADAKLLPRSAHAQPLTRPPATQSIAAPQRASQRTQEQRSGGKNVLRDRYELVAVLGRGSTGIVYRALDRHRAHLPEAARSVALKVLNANFRTHPQALAELEREFHQAQSLSHPNLVSVFDLDRDGDTYFIVQELLEGVLLSEILRRLEARPMAKDRALSIVAGIGAALAYAHRRGIVHGDLKPRNVMITSGGEVKVLDFGFARRYPLEPSIIEALQNDLVMAATAPAYASIERVSGEPAEPQDDVYSFACIAYEVLSGQHPFGGRSGLLAKAHGRHAKHITGLTHRQWHALQRGLRWSREDRRIDMVELLTGLGCSELRQRAFTPQELTVEERSSLPMARKVALASVLFAVTVGGVLWALQSTETFSRAAPQSRPPAAAAPAPTPAAAPPEPATVGPTAAASGAVPIPASAGVIAFEKDTYVAKESDGSVRLTVKRTGSVRNETSFRWTLRPNSAGAGTDYAAIGPNREYLAPGAETLNLTIPLVSDAVRENTELFLVELQSVDGSVALGELPRASVLVVDDD